jgi:hypothetical protein
MIAINWTHSFQMRAQDQKLANQGYIYMAPFWNETLLVQTPKEKKLKKASS